MPDDVIDRERQVCAAVGLSPSTLRRLIRAGKFPPPLRLSANSKGWLRSSVRSWLAARGHEQIPAPEKAIEERKRRRVEQRTPRRPPKPAPPRSRSHRAQRPR